MSTFNVPKGWKLVPAEPTPEMLIAGTDAHRTLEKWRATLAARVNWTRS